MWSCSVEYNSIALPGFKFQRYSISCWCYGFFIKSVQQSTLSIKINHLRSIRTSIHFDPHPNPALRAPGWGEEAQEPGFEGRLESVVHHTVGIGVPWKSPDAFLLSILLPVLPTITEHQQIAGHPVRAPIPSLCCHSSDLHSLSKVNLQPLIFVWYKWGPTTSSISSIQPCKPRTVAAGQPWGAAEGGLRQGRGQGSFTAVMATCRVRCGRVQKFCILEIQRVQSKAWSSLCKSISGGQRVWNRRRKDLKTEDDIQSEGEDWSSSQETRAIFSSSSLL